MVAMDDHVQSSALSPASPRRRTQRRPLACRACTRSKVRCDKTVPCSRCQKRGIACGREDVQISTKYAKIKASQSQIEGNSSGLADVGGNVNTLHDANIALQSHNTEHLTFDSQSSPTHQSPAHLVYVVPSLRSHHGKQAEFEDLATAIEGLAWGRHQCHRYPHYDCLQVESTSASNGEKAQTYELPHGHPSAEDARPLVDFHVRMLAWTHNVLHVPTFQDDCNRFWQSGVIVSKQWLATYYAVLSSSAWTLQNSQATTWRNFLQGAEDHAKRFFEMMKSVLNSTDFMGQHSVHSVQAICISGLVANVLGESDALTVMVNAGVRIAQCLGLHRIPESNSSEPWDIYVSREVGRRVWWKLVELDQHSMPYTGSCCINMKQFTTRRPLNCNDHDLLPRPESTLTASSYSLIMVNMALLIPTLLDGLWTIEDSTSRYEHVINVDRRMRALVANIPSAILRSNGTAEVEPEWLQLARRTLAISAADKVRPEVQVKIYLCTASNHCQIIMIHRSFLVKSFQSPAYLFTRNTCVSAAVTILREHEQIYEHQESCPILWLHSAFCVTAIVVICLNMLYCRDHMSMDRQLHFETMIRKARSRLSLNLTDTMARRGVFLVDALLHESPRHESDANPLESSADRPEFYHILERFMQRDQPTPTSESDLSFSGGGGVLGFDDFNIWYDQTFG